MSNLGIGRNPSSLRVVLEFRGRLDLPLVMLSRQLDVEAALRGGRLASRLRAVSIRWLSKL